jgi:hypothetical protein
MSRNSTGKLLICFGCGEKNDECICDDITLIADQAKFAGKFQLCELE